MIDHLEKIIELAREYCFTNVFFTNAQEHLNAVSDLLHYDEESIEQDSLCKMLRIIFGYSKTCQFKKDLKSRKLMLMEKGLVEYEFDSGMADTNYIRLTQKAKDEFLGDVDLKEQTKHRGKRKAH